MMATLDGLVIVGGMANGFYPNDHGGGIYVERFSNRKVALRQLKVVGNTARKGGGIFIGDGTEVEAILENIDITGNSASYGGGLYTAPESHSFLYNVSIKQNTALEGGGVFMDGITDWKNGELENNVANEGAGILAGVGGAGTLSGIMVVNNVASEEGGGLFLRETQNAVVLENVVFGRNNAGYGGAVYVFNSIPSEWRNVTIVENQAHHGGGYYSSGTGYLTFRNSLLVGNKGGDCVGTVNSVSSHNLVQDESNTCNLQDGWNGNQTGKNARLVLKEGAIYQLMIDSPALDAADGSTCPSEDLRGVLRPQDSNGDSIARCDIGALEFRVHEPLHPPTAVIPVMPASGSTVYLNWSGKDTLWIKWPHVSDSDDDILFYRWELGDTSMQQVYLSIWAGTDTSVAVPHHELIVLLDSLDELQMNGRWFGHRVVVWDGTVLAGGQRLEVKGPVQKFYLQLKNSVPPATSFYFPSAGEVIEITGNPTDTLWIAWQDVNDPDGDPVYYRWELAQDSLFTKYVYSYTVGRDTTLGLSYRKLADLLDSLGIKLGQKQRLYQRVVTTDSSRIEGGGVLEVVGPAVALVMVRGQLTAAERGLLSNFAFRGHYPNPVRTGVVELVLDLPFPSQVVVDIYDMLGRLVQRTPRMWLEAGRSRRVRLVVKDLASGIYVYQVSVELPDGVRQVFHGQMVCVR